MFTVKHVVVFFILQNTVSSYCFSKDCLTSRYSSSTNRDVVLPDADGPQYWDEYLENSNENSENNLIENSENYSNEKSENYSNENSENYSNEISENYSNENSEYNSNENSENNSNENSKNNSNENSENNSNENSENNSNDNSENDSNKNCFGEEHSLISRSDIKYLIEEKTDIFQIKEKIVSSFYPVAEEIFEKHMGEVEEFLEKIHNRPEHMLHILHDMALLRQKLEPEVEEIATQLEQFYTLEDDINDVEKNSANMLIKLEKYKNMCKINCEEISIENRFGHTTDNNPFIVSQSVDKYCVRVKDLNDDINKKLIEVQAQLVEDLNQQLQIRDKMYAQKITEIKINLKEAAVQQFGKTMYDILSLQDDYHHFVKDLNHVNISSETYNILENSAEIGFRLIGLHRDLEKYRQYCMKCHMNQRVKRSVFDMLDGRLDGAEESSVIPIEKITHAETNYVDELIKARIDEIRESIESNFTSMFEELDEQLDDPDVIDAYVTQLLPIQNEIGNDIKTEQEALCRLSSRIPEASIDKLLALSKEFKQIIQNLESAKQFINQFISRNSI